MRVKQGLTARSISRVIGSNRQPSHNDPVTTNDPSASRTAELILGPTPLIRTTLRGMSYPLNVDGGFWVQLPGPCNGVSLGRKNCARSFGVRLSHRIITLNTAFNKKVVAHWEDPFFRRCQIGQRDRLYNALPSRS